MLLDCIKVLAVYLQYIVFCRGGKYLKGEKMRLYSKHWKTEANGKVKENYFIK